MIQIQTWKMMASNMSPAHWNLVIIQISLLKQEPLSNGLFTLKKAVLTAATIRFCCQILIPNVFLNTIEFTPKKTGIYTYSCWMGMITGKIYVESE